MGTYFERIGKVERGQQFTTRLPEPEELRKWAAALVVTMSEMLRELGYLEESEDDKPRSTELALTQAADLVRESGLSSIEQELVLDTIKHVRRMWEERQN